MWHLINSLMNGICPHKGATYGCASNQLGQQQSAFITNFMFAAQSDYKYESTNKLHACEKIQAKMNYLITMDHGKKPKHLRENSICSFSQLDCGRFFFYKDGANAYA